MLSPERRKDDPCRARRDPAATVYVVLPVDVAGEE